jgi:hypothetical protein
LPQFLQKPAIDASRGLIVRSVFLHGPAHRARIAREPARGMCFSLLKQIAGKSLLAASAVVREEVK